LPATEEVVDPYGQLKANMRADIDRLIQQANEEPAAPPAAPVAPIVAHTSEPEAAAVASAPTNQRATNPRTRTRKPKAPKASATGIPDELCPVISGNEPLKLDEDGDYIAEDQEKRLHHFYYGLREATLVSLKQATPRSSLYLYTEGDDPVCLKPGKIMLDSGAQVYILISPAIAKNMGLTIMPGTGRLRGVGGAGGSLGRTVEDITIRLGNCSDGELNVPAMSGCFTVSIQPIVMTQELVDSIGHHVLLGQNFMRLCGGIVDPLTERFVYYPALLSQGCTRVMCSVPCNMSRPRTTHDISSPSGKLYEPFGGDLTPTSPEIPVNSIAVHGASEPDIPVERLLSRLVCAPAILAQVSPSTVAVSKQYPGFPQADNLSNNPQYLAGRRENTARNKENAQAAHELLTQAQLNTPFEGPNILEPLGIVYPMRALKQSGRLLESSKLDLTGSAVTQQFDTLKQSLLREVKAFIDDALADRAPQAPSPSWVEIVNKPSQPAATPSPAAAPTEPAAPKTTAAPKPSTAENAPATELRRSARLSDPAALHNVVTTAMKGLDLPVVEYRRNAPTRDPRALTEAPLPQEKSPAFNAILTARRARVQTMGVAPGGIPTVLAFASLIRTASATTSPRS
jgi:hypothetical protein